MLSTQATRQQQHPQPQRDQATRPGPPLSEFPPIAQSVCATRSADQHVAAVQRGPNWASLASTPYIHNNGFAPLLSTEDEERDEPTVKESQFTLVTSKRNKRTRDHSKEQSTFNVERGSLSRRAPTVLGKSRVSESKLTAARFIRSINFMHTVYP